MIISPPSSVSGVVEHVEITEQTVRLKLSELADEGAIATRKIGSGRVWWSANMDDETEGPES